MSLRALATLPLALWLGAAIFFSAVVAPAAFAVLPTRALAGALVGRVLPVLFVTGIAAALLAAAGARTTRLRRIYLASVIAVAASCAVAQFGVAPRIADLRERIGASLDALPPGDAQRRAFGRLHAISVGWLGVAILASATALVVGGEAGSRRDVRV